MPNVLHSSLGSAEAHEVKDIDTAAAKEVLVANGAGGGTWQRNPLSDHAEMSITNNATVTAVTAAVDATLNTDSDYVKITAGWSSTHLQGVSFSVDKLVVSVTGHYFVNFWGDVKIPLNNNFVGIKYAINDTTPFSTQKIVSQSATTNDYRNLYASAIVPLTAGDSVSIYIAGTKTDNLIVEEAGLSLMLIHES